MVPEATKLLLLALLFGLLIGALKNTKNGNAECVHQALHLDVCKQKLNYNGFIEEGFVFRIVRVKRWAVHSAVAAEGSHQGPKFFLATLLRMFLLSSWWQDSSCIVKPHVHESGRKKRGRTKAIYPEIPTSHCL